MATSATVRAMSGDPDGARSHLREAKVLADEFDDPGADAALALTESFIALSDADLETLGRVYREWAPRMRDRGDLPSLSHLLGCYGFSLLQSAQPEKARPLFEEALGITRRLENRDTILYLVDGLACQAAMISADDTRLELIRQMGIRPVDRRNFGDLEFDEEKYKSDKSKGCMCYQHCQQHVE